MVIGILLHQAFVSERSDIPLKFAVSQTSAPNLACCNIAVVFSQDEGGDLGGSEEAHQAQQFCS
jgi:hypothetical protein